MAKLTPAERAILINQYRILSALEDDEDGYKEVITILTKGYEAHYEDNIDGMSEPFDKSCSDFVDNIMVMYFHIKCAKNKAALANPGGDRDASGRLRLENFEPKFPGFDGNNQGRELSYARFIIANGGFLEHNHDLNSHGSQPDYEAMLDLWQSWGSPVELTEEQADELLSV